MGVQGLMKLLADHAPGCLKEAKMETFFGRKIAVDASMHIYQFLVVVGRTGDQLLTSETGEVTSHLQGMFYRTARMLEAGLKPVFVFDGKPPEMKKDELARRFEKRADATDALAAAKEAGNEEDVAKYSKRTVKVTREHNEECRRLLRLMGVPLVEAPSEAEAQCAALAKDPSLSIYGMSSEDMDSLTFATPRLIRNLMAPATAKLAIMEIEYAKVLEELSLTSDQFVDLCILCGCDYCGRIPGIGPVRALQLLQKHGSLEGVLASLDKGKFPLPEPYPYEEARGLFKEPDVLSGENLPPLKWSAPDEEGLVQFLVGEKSFNEDRIRKAVSRITASRGKSTQGRLESFFGPTTTVKSSTGAKRKEEPAKGGKGGAKGAKKGKLGGFGKK